MRKKTVKCLCDNIFWYLIYLLPLIIFAIYSFQNGTFVPLTDCMSAIHLDIFSNNVIFTSLQSLFGTSGIMPLFNNADILAYLSYFVSVFIVHLAVDFLLFIPRFAMSLLDKFGGVRDDV